MENKVSFSIITPAFNSAAFIAQTIESVVSQSWRAKEYIIVDGGSRDGTPEIVRKYSRHVDIFISESDGSMYEAINKGILRCSGEYVAVLNSDDYYVHSDVLSRVAERIKDQRPEGVYGNRIDVDKGGLLLKRRRSFPVKYNELLASRNLTFISHPCLFLSRRTIQDVGPYDVRYKYASDLDYVLRVLSRARLCYMDEDVVCFRVHGGSLTGQGRINDERLRILQAHGACGTVTCLGLWRYCRVWSRYFARNPASMLSVMRNLCGRNLRF